MIYFSIVIPTYNAETSINRALQSVINQSLQDFEIIVVDDGSTDNTRNVLDLFFKNQDVQHKVIYQKNNGAASARNIAVKSAKGKYIAFLDADDEWHNKKLEIQLRYIKKLDAKFISCEYTYENFNVNINGITLREYSFNDFLFKNRSSTPCVIIEKNLFNQVGGFQESQRYSEDYFLWLKVSYTTKLVKLNLPLVRLYKNAYGESGLSSQLWKMEKNELGNYVKLYRENYINKLVTIKYLFISFIKFLKRYLTVLTRRSFS